VNSPNGTPTGSVLFSDRGVSLGSAVLNGGVASFTIGSLTIGDHSISASYDGGNTNFGRSQSLQPASLSVVQIPSQFNGITSPQAMAYGTGSINLPGSISGKPGSVQQFTDPSPIGSGGVVLPYDITGVSTDSATYSMWINTSLKTAQLLFTVAYYHPYLFLENDQLKLGWDGAGPDTGWISADTTPVSDGRWHHIAVTFDNGKITLYKDGIATNDNFVVSSRGTADYPVNLGGSTNHLPSFIGQIWNAKIWAKALSAADIQADLYQTYGTAIPAGLKLLASFDANANTAINLVNGAAGTRCRSPSALPPPSCSQPVRMGPSRPAS
jgi:hypothetical protein